LRIAVVAFGDASRGDDAIGTDVVSRMAGVEQVVDLVPMNGGSDVLRTLESPCEFDGLAIAQLRSCR
jgi:hypothetical protein